MNQPMPSRRQPARRSQRHFERRAAGKYPYFKLAQRDEVSFCFRDGKQAFDSEAAALDAAKRPGTYRISSVYADGSRVDGEPFSV